MKKSRKQKYGDAKPSGKSRYGAKVTRRARLARDLGMDPRTPLPVLRSEEVAEWQPREPVTAIDLGAGV